MLANFSGAKKTISIPVNQILPQEISKTMTAQQDTDHAWTLEMAPPPAHLNFGNTCDIDQQKLLALDVTITWTKGPATQAGQIQVDTYVTAKNPAARTITVNITDQIRSGTAVLNTANSGDVDVAANTQVVVFHHTYVAPSGTTNLNDIATATYIDKVTGIPVPGNTTATASATVQTGTELNMTATILDSESITGSGLDFKAAAPLVGSFANYTAGTFTTGPVDWSSGTQSAGSSVTFNKTVRIDGVRSTNGDLIDTANLTTSGGVTANASVDVDIQSSALVSLTINKVIGPALTSGSQTFTVHVKNSSDVEVAAPTITFNASDTSKSVTVGNLAPGSYTVSEDPDPNYKPPEAPKSVTIALPNCSGSVDFANVLKNSPTISTQAVPTVGVVGTALTVGDTATFTGGDNPTARCCSRCTATLLAQ